MRLGRRTALAAYILFMPGGFILAGALLARYLNNRYGSGAKTRQRRNGRTPGSDDIGNTRKESHGE